MTRNTDAFEFDFLDIPLEIDNGEDDTAYVKKEIMDHEAVWTIYSGRGEKMGYAANREVAMAMVRQSELTVHSVH